MSFFTPFKYWLPLHELDQYYIYLELHTKFVVYTEKSLKRESVVLSKYLEDAFNHNLKLIWLAPYHPSILAFIPKILQENLVWIDVASFTEDLSPFPTVISHDSLLAEYLRSISSKEKFTIKIHPLIKDIFFIESSQSYILHSLKQSALRLKTITHFQHIWQYNYRKNNSLWASLQSVEALRYKIKPKYFILGGSSVDLFLDEYVKKKTNNGNDLWVADTAFAACILRGIIPNVLFSLDAGFASFEHFSYILKRIQDKKIDIVLDPLSFPKLYKVTMFNMFLYTHSNPLLVDSKAMKFPVLYNSTGDVYGLIVALYNFIYPQESMPIVIGRDQKAIHKVTHLRGSGYYMRQYCENNRFYTVANYFYNLSQKYTS